MANLPEGINNPVVARVLVAWEMVKVAYPGGLEYENSKAQLRNMVNAFIKAEKAMENQVEITTE